MSAVGDIPNDCSRSNVDAVRKETTAMPVVDAPAPVDIEAQRNAESVIKEINDLNARAKSRGFIDDQKGIVPRACLCPESLPCI